MTQQEIRDRLCDQTMENLFLPRAEVMAEIDTWEIEPWWRDGAVMGAIMRRGPELHFAVFGICSIDRRVVVEALRPQFERYGYVETKTPRHLERQHRFNRAIGFRTVMIDEHDVHYRIERDQCRLLR